jgi:hypothetical protein
LIQFGSAEQTTLELAIHKGKKRQVNTYEAAVFENAIAVLALLEPLFTKILVQEFQFVEACFCHASDLWQK